MLRGGCEHLELRGEALADRLGADAAAAKRTATWPASALGASPPSRRRPVADGRMRGAASSSAWV